MTTQQIIQSLYRAFNVLCKHPSNPSSRQHIVLVSWHSLVRKGRIHQCYHPGCYQNNSTPRYQQVVREVEMKQLHQDVLCVGCRHWIYAPRSSRTIPMRKVGLEQ